MPFKSKAQQRFLEANPDKVGGREKLKEWEGATNFNTLPERKGVFSNRRSAMQVAS